jgi:DUF4097 and DUF4098 domain-containing protein YvlB
MPSFRPAHAAALALALAAAPVLAQGPDIDKVNGAITAEAGKAYGDLSTVNGSIRIEAGATVGDAETVNGSIKVAEGARLASVQTVNGSARLEPNVRVAGDVETVNGSIFVDRGGNVGDDVETVNGAIGLVDTDVGGDVATVNGDITIGIGSHVRGGITVTKPSNNWMPISIGKRRIPKIVIGPQARVDGPLRFEREVRLYVHDSARIGPVSGATAVRYSSDRAPQD